jgi:hypothetical protein
MDEQAVSFGFGPGFPNNHNNNLMLSLSKHEDHRTKP